MPNYTDIVLKKCLELKKWEYLLVVTDEKLYGIAKEFLSAADKITSKTKLIKIPIPKVSGTEPSEKIAKEMFSHGLTRTEIDPSPLFDSSLQLP